MTSEAPGLVRAFFELGAAGDYMGVHECLDPDVVWFGTRGGLDESQVVRGPKAVIAYMREIQETWERFDVEIERLIEAGGAIVVFMRETAHARQGGPEVQNDTAVIIKMREQRNVEISGYLDRGEALEAVGL